MIIYNIGELWGLPNLNNKCYQVETTVVVQYVDHSPGERKTATAVSSPPSDECLHLPTLKAISLFEMAVSSECMILVF